MPGWNTAIILLLSVITFAAMAQAANIGGDIRHPEIREAGEVPGPPLGREIGSFVVGTKWVWPTCETLHFIGLSLFFGVAALVDLRMLGLMKSVPIMPFIACCRGAFWDTGSTRSPGCSSLSVRSAAVHAEHGVPVEDGADPADRPQRALLHDFR